MASRKILTKKSRYTQSNRTAKPAASRRDLKKRVERLLHIEDAKPTSSEVAQRILPLLLSFGGGVALIGGAVRDVARAGKYGFSSDLDFIVYNSDRSIFRERLLTLGAEPNRFGGFRLRNFRHQVDLWHISDTWAKTAGLVAVDSIEDVLNCTFFDWDSALYDVTRRKLIAKPDYLDILHSNVMEIRLEPNPNIPGSIVRALRRAALWNVQFGPKLSDYVRRHLRTYRWDELTKLDEQAFSQPVLKHIDPSKLRARLEKISANLVTHPVPNWRPQMEFGLLIEQDPSSHSHLNPQAINRLGQNE